MNENANDAVSLAESQITAWRATFASVVAPDPTPTQSGYLSGLEAALAIIAFAPTRPGDPRFATIQDLLNDLPDMPPLSPQARAAQQDVWDAALPAEDSGHEGPASSQRDPDASAAGTATGSQFYDDLRKDLQDPRFRAAYEEAERLITAEDARRNTDGPPSTRPSADDVAIEEQFQDAAPDLSPGRVPPQARFQHDPYCAGDYAICICSRLARARAEESSRLQVAWVSEQAAVQVGYESARRDAIGAVESLAHESTCATIEGASSPGRPCDCTVGVVARLLVAMTFAG
jgi:hypothetical protein